MIKQKELSHRAAALNALQKARAVDFAQRHRFAARTCVIPRHIYRAGRANGKAVPALQATFVHNCLTALNGDGGINTIFGAQTATDTFLFIN